MTNSSKSKKLIEDLISNEDIRINAKEFLNTQLKEFKFIADKISYLRYLRSKISDNYIPDKIRNNYHKILNEKSWSQALSYLDGKSLTKEEQKKIWSEIEDSEFNLPLLKNRLDEIYNLIPQEILTLSSKKDTSYKALQWKGSAESLNILFEELITKDLISDNTSKEKFEYGFSGKDISEPLEIIWLPKTTNGDQLLTSLMYFLKKLSDIGLIDSHKGNRAYNKSVAYIFTDEKLNLIDNKLKDANRNFKDSSDSNRTIIDELLINVAPPRNTVEVSGGK